MLNTKRLKIVPATAEMTRAALEGASALAKSLGAAVPPTWPPEFLDEAALQYFLDRLEENPQWAEWGFRFVLLSPDDSSRILIGSCGYKGAPTDQGEVEIGYGIVSDQRRRGYASEAVMALLAQAFAAPDVMRVLAETLPENEGSKGVLTKCGFHFSGDGSEPGAIRYELTRAEYENNAKTP